MPNTDIQSLVTSFVTQLVSVVEQTATERARAAIVAAVGGASLPKRRGRPPKNAFAFSAGKVSLGKVSGGRKRPKQLCPVPGCKNPAAPVFGMVCKDHKGVSKAKIAKYRLARKQAKSNA